MCATGPHRASLSIQVFPFPHLYAEEITTDNAEAFLKACKSTYDSPTQRNGSRAAPYQPLCGDDAAHTSTGARHILVECYSPWCPHCQRFAPTFERLAYTYVSRPTHSMAGTVAADASACVVRCSYSHEATVTVAKIDCANQQDLCK